MTARNKEHSGITRILVVTGDHHLPDPTKRDSRYNEEDRVTRYTVESENFESIHNHSAYALIEKDKASE